MNVTMNGFTKPTRQETYKKLIQAIKDDKVMPLKSDISKSGDTCMYQYPSGRRCAVGALFSDEQIAWLKRYSYLSNSVSNLKIYGPGKDNLEFVTGLSYYELCELQDAHDTLIVSSYGNYDRDECLSMLINRVKKVKKKFDNWRESV